MTYAVIDLETTIAASYGRKANPLSEENSVVAGAVKRQDISSPKVFYCADYKEAISSTILQYLHNIKTLVGHNLKFDLLHLWPQIADSKYEAWDTQLAEHIISGQQRGFVSLRDLATITYNAAVRDKNMEKFWSEGICTSKIPKSIVLADVFADVQDTEKVLLGQIEKAKELGCFSLIRAFGEGLLATAEMEWNGLQIDKCHFDVLKSDLKSTLQKVEIELEYLMHEYIPSQIEINLNSKDQLSVILFGGNLKYKEPQLIYDDGIQVCYKTGIRKGEPKTKLIDIDHYFDQQAQSKFKVLTKRTGIYSVDDEVLNDILTGDTKLPAKLKRLVELVLDYRKLFKDYSTYYVGIEKAIYSTDSCLHPQFNFVATYTGRLSSTSPNAQNLPKPDRSNITQAIVSRFPGGKLLAFDYNQLEVIGLALLSNDDILRHEIRDGIDIHRRNASWLYNKSEDQITDEERQITKGTTFKLLYGGTAYSMAKSTNLEVDKCESFINGFFNKYKGVKLYYQNVINTVRNSRISNDVELAPGIGQGIGRYQIFTGRILTFKETLRTTRAGTTVGFSRPELMNFPVQGLSTGDLAVIMLGELYRKSQQHRDKYRLINFIHDSYIVDCAAEHVDFALQHIKSVLESVPEVLKRIFNKETDLPFRVKSKVGPNFYEVMK